jgi:hypothetical protein
MFRGTYFAANLHVSVARKEVEWRQMNGKGTQMSLQPCHKYFLLIRL